MTIGRHARISRAEERGRVMRYPTQVCGALSISAASDADRQYLSVSHDNSGRLPLGVQNFWRISARTTSVLDLRDGSLINLGVESADVRHPIVDTRAVELLFA